MVVFAQGFKGIKAQRLAACRSVRREDGDLVGNDEDVGGLLHPLSGPWAAA